MPHPVACIQNSIERRGQGTMCMHMLLQMTRKLINMQYLRRRQAIISYSEFRRLHAPQNMETIKHGTTGAGFTSNINAWKYTARLCGQHGAAGPAAHTAINSKTPNTPADSVSACSADAMTERGQPPVVECDITGDQLSYRRGQSRCDMLITADDLKQSRYWQI